MRILAVETSCDDTSIALVEAEKSADKKGVPVFKVLENIVSSQTEIHRHWGGVVPNLAKREHLKNLPLIYKQLVASGQWPIPNLISVTVGPGLEPALWTGIEFAKKLSEELKIPLIGANHLEGHLYSFLLPQETISTKHEARSTKQIQTINFEFRNSDFGFPAIALLVSGGHTMLLLMKDLYHWKKLGETRDDAVGEAFDKVARIMGLPYPGGPEIEKLACEGNPKAIQFPRPMIHEKNYEFSFSGLKTSVLYYLRDRQPVILSEAKDLNSEAKPKKQGFFAPQNGAQNDSVADIAASFQAAAIDVLVSKTLRAVREFGAKSVILCGGVAANQALRAALFDASQTVGAKFIAPQMAYNSDNAAMIAASAYIRHIRRKKKLPLEANGNMSL